MWSLQLASRNKKLTSSFLRLFHMRSEMAIGCFDKKEMIFRFSYSEIDKCLPLSKFGHSSSIIPPNRSMWKYTFSSQTGLKSSGEDDDLDNGFSELEVVACNNAQMGTTRNINVNDLISDAELSDVGEDSENFDKHSHNVPVAENKVFYDHVMSSEFFRLVSSHTTDPFDNVLNKWINDGNELSKEEISKTMFSLRKCKRNQRALKLSFWLQESKAIDFKECDYAIRVDLIAKLLGIEKAEKYIQNIPKHFQGELIYQTLLSNSVILSNVNKSEEIFNKMKDDLRFPLSIVACNDLLSLYLKHDRKKMEGVLLLMESQNLKPTLETYKTLIDSRSRGNDISGMEQIYETMKSRGIKPDTETRFLLARHYVTCGLKQKAEAFLKEIENDSIQSKREMFQYLFHLYATLSKPVEVRKLWSFCEKHPSHGEILAAIAAWGVLKNVEEAEAIFYGVLKRWRKATADQYYALLRVYADNKECEKGKNLLQQVADNGIGISSWKWDMLVKVLLGAGEVEEADLALERAISQTKTSPRLSTYVKLMSQYASRGDVHSCERIFRKCKQLESRPGVLTHHFHALVQAYVTSKTPAYGMWERLKVGNVRVSKGLAAQLKGIDAFKKTEVSDFLD